MFTEVYYRDEDSYPVLVFVKPADADDPTTETHIIPMQAVADRMELYGFESIEQTLEYIGREAHDHETSDTLHADIQEAYGEVVQSEYAQTLMPNPQVEPRVRQTLMSPMTITPHKRTKLREVRGESLQVLGMRSMIHSEPGARLMDASRPVERTRPAAAEALEASEEAVSKAVEELQRRTGELEAWRVETVCGYIPQLRDKLLELTESENQ